MKKMILSLALAGVLFGLSSCNSDSPAQYEAWGAYDDFSSEIDVADGTVFFAKPGAAFVDDFYNNAIEPADGSRILIYFIYEKDDQYNEFGPGKRIPITLTYPQLFDSFMPVSSSDYSDPILGIVSNYAGNPDIGMISNMLVFRPEFFYYTKNKPENRPIAIADFDLVIDGQLEGDVINARLKHFANRGSDEEVGAGVSNAVFDIDNDGYGNDGRVPIAFDFQYVASDLSLDVNKEYTIRVEYEVYKANIADGSETKTMELKWTPNKPTTNN